MAALCRSSRLEIFCKKGVFKDFEKFTGKTYVGVNKVAGVHPRDSRRDSKIKVNVAKF